MKTIAKMALLCAAALPVPAIAQSDPEALKASVEKLVSFGTRHTLSSNDDPVRGIGAARRWVGHVFADISAKCGDCLVIESLERNFSGPRAPDGVNVVDVLGVQMGTSGWANVIIVAGHIDSRVSNVADYTSDAPGANDDASGVALVLEAARILSQKAFDATIVYAVLSGEEQGLWGGQLLAETAQARGWQVSAMLNNDIVGNTVGTDGRTVTDRVRVFSEGIRASESAAETLARRNSGGEDDGPSRSLMRYVEMLSMREVSEDRLTVAGIRRPDRFARGGDHLPALEIGFPAVRFTVGIENYHQQHQDVRTEAGVIYGDTVDKMDFPYLAKVTDLNIATIAALANAPPAPQGVTLAGAVSSDTIVNWLPVKGASGYRVYWRSADAQNWRESKKVDSNATSLTLPGVIVDDTFAGVAAFSDTGEESIIAFAGLPPR